MSLLMQLLQNAIENSWLTHFSFLGHLYYKGYIVFIAIVWYHLHHFFCCLYCFPVACCFHCCQSLVLLFCFGCYDIILPITTTQWNQLPFQMPCTDLGSSSQNLEIIQSALTSKLIPARGLHLAQRGSATHLSGSTARPNLTGYDQEHNAQTDS